MRETPSRAVDTAKTVGVRAASLAAGVRRWDLLVNCTPVGMYPHVDESPLPASALSGRFVYDLVYNPPVDAPAARRGGGRLRDDRRSRHARRPGAGAVLVVDRNQGARPA